VSLLDDLRARDDVVTAATAALHEALADDAPTVATTSTALDDFVPAHGSQIMSLEVHAGNEDASVALVMSPALADALERSAADETLPTAVAPLLDAIARAVAEVAGEEVETETAVSSDLTTVRERVGDASELALSFVLSGADEAAVGCLVVAVGAATASDEVFAAMSPDGSSSLSMGNGSATPKVLADVEMGVTAELGRCHMSVRELLSLTPGAVIDLDRAAGAPVDVLVNGTLIARGEVVVVDEEFGIRISEILSNGAPAA